MGSGQSGPVILAGLGMKCSADDGTNVASPWANQSHQGCFDALMQLRKPGRFDDGNGNVTIWNFSYSCTEPNGVSLGANITSAGECKTLALAKNTGGMYTVHFGPTEIESVNFDPVKVVLPVAAPVATPIASSVASVAGPSTVVTIPARTKKEIEVAGQASKDLWDLLQNFHSKTQSAWKNTNTSDFYSSMTFYTTTNDMYSRELLKEIENITQKYDVILKAAAKESFSQPDLGTVAGWSVFWILLVLILCIVLAVYFKQPAQLFKSARVDAKV